MLGGTENNSNCIKIKSILINNKIISVGFKANSSKHIYVNYINSYRMENKITNIYVLGLKLNYVNYVLE